MLRNKETKEWIVVVTGEDENNLENSVTGDGIRNDDTYELNYQFKKTGFKRNLLKVKGIDLTKSTQRILNQIFSDCESLGDVKREVQSFVVLLGTKLLNPFHYRKIKKDYPPEIVRIVERGSKGKRDEYFYLQDILSTYLYLKYVEERGNMENVCTNSVTIVDTLGVVDKKDEEHLKNTWEEQPITERLGLTSFDEFMKVMGSNGVLHTEYKLVG
jgi:hypothetical protein